VSPRYRLVIFDFDGTLADSGDWFLAQADDLADRFRFKKVTPDEVEMLRGRTTREVIRYLGIPRWKLPRMARHMHARLAAEADKIKLFPGVEALLAELDDAGVEIAVVTSNAERNARAILGAANVARVRHWECGASLFGKARRFRRVLRRSGVARGDAISVGDETRDITAARRVGIAAGAVTWGYARRDALITLGPDRLYDDAAAVAAHILGERVAA